MGKAEIKQILFDQLYQYDFQYQYRHFYTSAASPGNDFSLG